MTTNLPLDFINRRLDEANNQDANIRITRAMGSTVDFLDVRIENNQGQLKTTVFHKSAAEPYITPFLSDHPRHIHRNTIKGALFRAVRLCSEVEDFDKERSNIELTLLLNGYPPKFIVCHFKRFFEQHNALSLMQQLDNDVYRALHLKLVSEPTRREREREDRLANQYQSTSKSNQQQQQGWKRKEIRVSFTFESGSLLELKRELHCLWQKYYIYDGSPMNEVTLKIRTRNNKSLSQLLIKKKPPKSMLVSVDSSNIK